MVRGAYDQLSPHATTGVYSKSIHEKYIVTGTWRSKEQGDSKGLRMLALDDSLIEGLAILNG